ncbi:hypothetical protein K0M31_006988 [Melipona bicolor]|uniref:Uncharacterized protein n=1 Tax=Melipona bicolor TaxID=60889 RepID=A0AA40FRF3_9HYME|nr:hypothetical protein K0M31_011040 [Melipona bicolor]KAK1123960.1 hypothetical protein K0M31_006988 [Melipona bicolor]
MADNQQLKGNLAAIQHQLAELTYKIATMETNFSRQRSLERRPRSRDRRSISRGRRFPARPYTPAEGLCYYHFNFGARAYKCQKPCNWSPTTTETTQQKEN